MCDVERRMDLCTIYIYQIVKGVGCGGSKSEQGP